MLHDGYDIVLRTTNLGRLCRFSVCVTCFCTTGPAVEMTTWISRRVSVIEKNWENKEQETSMLFRNVIMPSLGHRTSWYVVAIRILIGRISTFQTQHRKINIIKNSFPGLRQVYCARTCKIVIAGWISSAEFLIGHCVGFKVLSTLGNFMVRIHQRNLTFRLVLPRHWDRCMLTWITTKIITINTNVEPSSYYFNSIQ